MLDSKILRGYARMLLDLADAVEEKKVTFVDTPYVQHVFMKPERFDRTFDKEAQKDVQVTVEQVLCSHDLKAYAFYYVFAQCRVSGQFFINSELSKAIAEKLHHFSPL